MLYFLIIPVLVILFFNRKKLFSKTVVKKPLRIFKPYEYHKFELDIISLVNEYRMNVGLSSLRVKDEISSICSEHNLDMIKYNLTSHNGFVGRSEEITNMFDAITVSENVASGFSSAKGVVDAWIASPEHLKNIVSDATHMGLSAVLSETTNKWYFTNIFMKIKN